MQLPEIKTRLESIEHGDTRPDFLLAEHCPDGDPPLTSRRGIERATPHPVIHPLPDREIELHPAAVVIVHLAAPCDIGRSTRLVPRDFNCRRIPEAKPSRALKILFTCGSTEGTDHHATSAAQGVGEGEPRKFLTRICSSGPCAFHVPTPARDAIASSTRSGEIRLRHMRS